MDDDDEFNQRFNEQLKMFNDIDTIVTKAAQENGVYEEEKDLNCLNCNFKNSLPFNSKNKEQ